jgi:hypothetical protein
VPRTEILFSTSDSLRPRSPSVTRTDSQFVLEVKILIRKALIERPQYLVSQPISSNDWVVWKDP